MADITPEAIGTPVHLAIYDISGGWARWLSPVLFCRRIPIAPHTGILIFGHEFYWSGGLQKTSHEEFMNSWRIRPIEIVELGRTQIPEDLFQDFILNVTSQYTANTYSLLDNNCNAFTEQCAQFLLGRSIPSSIREAPEAVKQSPLGRFLFFFLALPPSGRHLCVVVLHLALGLASLVSLKTISASSSFTSTSSLGDLSGCPMADDATVGFASVVLTIDCVYSAWLLASLGVAWRSGSECCVPLPDRHPLLCRLSALALALFLYASAVSLHTLQSTLSRLLPDECASAVTHLGWAGTLAWLLLLLSLIPRVLVSHVEVVRGLVRERFTGRPHTSSLAAAAEEGGHEP